MDMDNVISIVGTLLGVAVGGAISYLFNSRLWVRQARLNVDIGTVGRIENIIQQLVAAQSEGRKLVGSGQAALDSAYEHGAAWNPAKAAFNAAAGTITERFDTCDVRKCLAKFEELLTRSENGKVSSIDFINAASDLLSVLQVEVFKRIR
jgi:hypothetical protein